MEQPNPNNNNNNNNIIIINNDDNNHNNNNNNNNNQHNNQFKFSTDSDNNIRGNRSVEDITDRLDQMNVDMDCKFMMNEIIYDDNFNENHQDNQEMAEANSKNFLNIPKLTKQFLISPPASPPVGWEPVTESSPCIDVQLISAIANLVPGKMHEIHPGNESQPGIYVEVCEDATFETASGSGGANQRSCKRIPRTMSPANGNCAFKQNQHCH